VCRQRPEIVGDEHRDGVRRRLLEILEQRVRGLLVQRVRAEDEVDAADRFERAHVQVATQLPDRVDPDLVPERLEHVQIRVRTALDRARIAEQGTLRIRARRGASLRPAAVEEVRVRRPLRSAASSSRWASACSGKAWRELVTDLLRDLFDGLGRVDDRDPVAKIDASSRYAVSTSCRNSPPSRSMRSPVRAERRRASSGSTASRNVTSGRTPRIAARFSASTRSTPSPRAMPW
jgi:hypothetical protein